LPEVATVAKSASTKNSLGKNVEPTVNGVAVILV